MSTFSYKALVSYDGESYLGWQIQPEKLKTVQGQINHCLEKITKSDQISSLGSGRTDSGVHALAQVVKLNIPFAIEEASLMKAMNSHLPHNIRVLEVKPSDEDFHPVRDALWKRYIYFFSIGEILPPHAFGKVTHVRQALDLEKVKEALTYFVGEHDFVNFSTKGTEVKSTIRTLHSAKLTTIESFYPYQNDVIYKFSFEGSGFLKQMVRLLVGAAFMCGKGKVDPCEIASFFQEDTTRKLGPVAPPDGLYLEHVEYEKSWASSD